MGAEAVVGASDEIMKKQGNRKALIILTDGVDYGSDANVGAAPTTTAGNQSAINCATGDSLKLDASGAWVAGPHFTDAAFLFQFGTGAIRGFAQREAKGVDHYAAEVNEHVPYHRAPDEELQI